MLDAKKVLAKLLAYVNGMTVQLNEMRSKSFPFTAETSGIAVVWINTQTTSASYFAVSDNGVAVSRGNSTGGFAYSVTFPVVKGHVYAVAYSDNVKNTLLKVYPLSISVS